MVGAYFVRVEHRALRRLRLLWFLFDWIRGAWNRIRLIGPVEPDPPTKLRDHRFEQPRSQGLF